MTRYYVIREVLGTPVRSAIGGPFCTKEEAEEAAESLRKTHSTYQPPKRFPIEGVPREAILSVIGVG